MIPCVSSRVNFIGALESLHVVLAYSSGIPSTKPSRDCYAMGGKGRYSPFSLCRIVGGVNERTVRTVRPRTSKNGTFFRFMRHDFRALEHICVFLMFLLLEMTIGIHGSS